MSHNGPSGGASSTVCGATVRISDGPMLWWGLRRALGKWFLVSEKMGLSHEELKQMYKEAHGEVPGLLNAPQS